MKRPFVMFTLALATACQGETDLQDLPVETRQQAVKSDVDARRSLVVTEQAVLARFSFQRVMD
jgi:hypothetical protein